MEEEEPIREERMEEEEPIREERNNCIFLERSRESNTDIKTQH